MRLALRPALVDKLAALPENGMGYQIVDLLLRSGAEVSGVVVFNAEEADIPDRLAVIEADIADVRLSKAKPS